MCVRIGVVHSGVQVVELNRRRVDFFIVDRKGIQRRAVHRHIFLRHKNRVCRFADRLHIRAGSAIVHVICAVRAAACGERVVELFFLIVVIKKARERAGIAVCVQFDVNQIRDAMHKIIDDFIQLPHGVRNHLVIGHCVGDNARNNAVPVVRIRRDRSVKCHNKTPLIKYV